MLPISSIPSATCSTTPNLGGIRQLRIYSQADYAAGQLSQGATAYLIAFTQYTGQYSERDQSGDGGQYTEQTISVRLPRYRQSIEIMRERLRDRRIVAEVLSANGDYHLISNAQISCTYTTGTALRDNNAYQLTITGTTLLRNYSSITAFTTLNGYDGVNLGSDFSSDQVPTADTIGVSATSYYMQVVTTQLDYVPTSTGNAADIRNRFVTASDGSRWAIDYLGRGMLLQRARHLQIEEITTTTSTIDLDIPDSAVTVAGSVAATDVLVSLNGSILQRDLSSTHGYSVDGDQILSPPGRPWEEGDRIRIYYF